MARVTFPPSAIADLLVAVDDVADHAETDETSIAIGSGVLDEIERKLRADAAVAVAHWLGARHALHRRQRYETKIRKRRNGAEAESNVRQLRPQGAVQ